MKYSARHLACTLAILAITAVSGGGCAVSKGAVDTSVDPTTPDADTPPGFGDAGDLCEAAQESNSYVGCDAWPTPVACSHSAERSSV